MINKFSLRMNTGRLSAQLDQRIFSARFVRAGRVRAAGNQLSSITIEPRALTDAWEKGLFNARPVFVDHAGFWEYPSLNNLVGVTQAASWNEANQSIEGTIKLYPNAPGASIANLLDDLLAEDHPPDIGLSMVFYPVWESKPHLSDGTLLSTGTKHYKLIPQVEASELAVSKDFVLAAASNSDKIRRIVGISHIESIDLVFEPAADGRILQALSAFHVSSSEGTAVSKDEVLAAPAADGRILQPLSVEAGTSFVGEGLSPSPPTGPSDGIFDIPIPDHPNSKQHMTPDPTSNHPRKGATTMNENLNSRGVQTNPETTPDGGEAIDKPSERAQSWISALELSTIEAMIRVSGLPAPSQEHLLNHHYAQPEDVQSAIENERAYLARLQEDKVVQIGGAPPRQPAISGMRTSLDQVKIALEALLEGVRPANNIQPLTGIRELYMLLSGDYELTGMFHPDRVALANVTTATMANITADVLNKRVMAEFALYPRWWEPIVVSEDFATLQDVKWILLGGIGELPTVAEGAAYTEMTWDDKKETSTFVKKGGYLGITLESVDKDDTARLRAAPRALAQAAWLTLSKSISSIFTSNSGAGPTLTDGTVLFHSSRGNIGTSALSIATWEAARTAMRKMTELNSGERLGALTVPRYLLVPPDLEITALQVLASEYDYTYALSNGTAAPVNPLTEGDSFNQRLQFARDRVVVVDLWTDTNNWYACADPRLYPTIGLGFRYGRTPEVFSVASPTAGLMFTNDTMPVKVRFFYATGPIDHRGLYGAVVA